MLNFYNSYTPIWLNLLEYLCSMCFCYTKLPTNCVTVVIARILQIMSVWYFYSAGESCVQHVKPKEYEDQLILTITKWTSRNLPAIFIRYRYQSSLSSHLYLKTKGRENCIYWHSLPEMRKRSWVSPTLKPWISKHFSVRNRPLQSFSIPV